MKVGSVIAEKYVVERVLGAGGAGIVLACRHRATGGLFALKILKSPTEEQAERLMREARLITKLKNEHVCRVFDIDRLPGGGLPTKYELASLWDYALVDLIGQQLGGGRPASYWSSTPWTFPARGVPWYFVVDTYFGHADPLDPAQLWQVRCVRGPADD